MLAIVSEKTGYPVEMLELSMDMESDLGIDSIKRVEILGAMQETAQFLEEQAAEQKNIVKQMREDKKSEITPSVSPNEPPKKTAMVITDKGYSDDLASKLGEVKEVAWEVLEMDNALEFLNKIEVKKGFKKLKCYSTLVLMLGAKDICLDETPYKDVSSTIGKAVDILTTHTKNKVYICLVPPVQPDKHLMPVVNLNYELEEIASEKSIEVIKTGDFFKLAKAKTLHPNSNKLTNKGVEFCISAITSVDIQERKYESSDEESDVDELGARREIMTVSEDEYKFITGPSGQSIIDIEKDSNTDIQKIQWRENKINTHGFLIEKAKQIISECASASKTSGVMRKRKVCKYFQTASGCTHGSYCNFLHVKETKRGMKK